MKIAVIFWSQTGNTEAMAQAVLEGVNLCGVDAQIFQVTDIDASTAAGFDRLALGCPAMGAEVLEESSFEPFFRELEACLSGKPIALFGSYGWGDGEWMRNWQERVLAAGAILMGGEGLTINEAPGETGLDVCRELGKALATG